MQDFNLNNSDQYFDVLKEIEDILHNKPQRDFDYDNFQEVKSRREIALGV